MHGIVNAPRTATLDEDQQFQALVECSEKYGLTVITVSEDCNMESPLMRRIVQSGRFQTRKQCTAPKRIQMRFNSRAYGPRNRWGELK